MNKLIEAQMCEAKRKSACDGCKEEIAKGDRIFISEDGSKIQCEDCYESAVRDIDQKQLSDLADKVREKINEVRNKLLPDPDIDIGSVSINYDIGRYNAWREVFYSGETNNSHFTMEIDDPSTWHRRTMRRGVTKWKDIDDLEKKIMKKLDDILFKMEQIINDNKDAIDNKFEQLKKDRERKSIFEGVKKGLKSIGIKGKNGYGNSLVVNDKKVEMDISSSYYSSDKINVEINFNINPEDVEKLKEVVDLVKTFCREKD